MSANTSKYPQPPFTHAIRLYGDRAGSKGTFRFAGFAWIQDTKVILVQGDAQSLSSAAEWRCFLRLTTLAHRLKKPIILWNLPVVHIATTQRQTSLDFAQAIQNAELELLKLPHPIITVFDETYNLTYTPPELIWNDGVVRVASSDIQSSALEKMKVVQRPTEIAPAILELLRQAEEIPTTELVENRQGSLRFLVEGRTEFSSNLHYNEETSHV
ncbi:MAG: hypothetical protein OXH39_20130 [Candidatus Poribacteria bacterium]|nr:hypothetical protein [Candidatus Poribacteria bacterium]